MAERTRASWAASQTRQAADKVKAVADAIDGSTSAATLVFDTTDEAEYLRDQSRRLTVLARRLDDIALAYVHKERQK